MSIRLVKKKLSMFVSEKIYSLNDAKNRFLIFLHPENLKQRIISAALMTPLFLSLALCSFAQECIPEKRFDCSVPDENGEWQCVPLSGGKTFTCQYEGFTTETEPDVCEPQWCSLPVQDCLLPPLTGGTDSCGEPCSKPSLEWGNCIHPDGTIGPIE